MTNAMTTPKASTVMTTWEEKLETVKAMVDPERKLTVPEFEAFCYQAKRTGLDPLARQIYFTKQSGKVSVCSTIDGLRLVSQRSGQYAGQVGPLWCGPDGVWREVWLDDKAFPAAAKVGILRHDFKEPLWAVATWKQYCPVKDGSPGFMWKKMGPLMLGKCAEALARRTAFPQELSGIYAQEEMEQAGAPKPPEMVEVTVAPVSVEEERNLGSGKEGEAARADENQQPPPARAAGPVDGFRNDAEKLSTHEELNALWESFKGLAAVKGNADVLNEGWGELAKQKKRVKALQAAR